MFNEPENIKKDEFFLEFEALMNRKQDLNTVDEVLRQQIRQRIEDTDTPLHVSNDL